MRIGIDVDGVLRDLIPKLIEVYKHNFPYNRVTPYNKWKWELVKNFPDDIRTKKEIHKWIFETVGHSIFTTAEVCDTGTVEAFNELVTESRHEIVIVSAQRPGTEPYTLEWLGKNGFRAKEVIFTKNKLESGCDVLVDDKQENLHEYFNAGKVAIKIKRPWNNQYNTALEWEKFTEAQRFLLTL